jgi:hypothetical protein
MRRCATTALLALVLLAPAATAEAAPYLSVGEAKTGIRSYLSDPHWWRYGFNAMQRADCWRTARNRVRCAPCFYDGDLDLWRAQARVLKVYGPPGRTRWTKMWAFRRVNTC